MITQATTDLQAALDELETIEGTGTQLVSVTAPPDTSLPSLVNKLQQEHAEAGQIKNDATRKNVQKALKRATKLAQTYQETPDTGLAIYAGIVDDELISYVLDGSMLETPIGESIYQCDSHFDVSPVKATINTGPAFGLLVVERGQAVVGQYNNGVVTLLHDLESQVMGKSRAGGQSAARFERERQRQADEFYDQVAEIANTAFIDQNKSTVQGLLIGGTLTTVKEFSDSTRLDHRLQDKIIGTYAVEYATEQGLDQLIDVGSSELKATIDTRTREVVNQFLEALSNDNDVTYGPERVQQAAEYGAVKTLLLGQDQYQSSPELVETVTEYGGDVCIVTGGFQQGKQFLEAFGGVGALLRFPVESNSN